ncbi:hypothetical protein VKS41_006590 [Umbelopsis sp. WA50703]
MATASSSAAQLINTTAKLAELSLAERQTASPANVQTTLASQESSSTMDVDPGVVNQPQENIHFAVYELFALASFERPVLFSIVSELFQICSSLAKNDTGQSDATAAIAKMLRKLNTAMRCEVEAMSSPKRENVMDVLAKWNATLLKLFKWDKDREQFIAPLDVKIFLNWLVAKYKQGRRLTPRDDRVIFRLTPGGLREAIQFSILPSSTHIASTVRQNDTSTQNQLPQPATLQSAAVSRQAIEHLVSYVPQDDTLDYIWYSDKETDAVESEESEDTDSDHDTEIFGSATEISGAEATDSDWSEINYMI